MVNDDAQIDVEPAQLNGLRHKKVLTFVSIYRYMCEERSKLNLNLYSAET